MQAWRWTLDVIPLATLGRGRASTVGVLRWRTLELAALFVLIAGGRWAIALNAVEVVGASMPVVHLWRRTLKVTARTILWRTLELLALIALTAWWRRTVILRPAPGVCAILCAICAVGAAVPGMHPWRRGRTISLRLIYAVRALMTVLHPRRRGWAFAVGALWRWALELAALFALITRWRAIALRVIHAVGAVVAVVHPWWGRWMFTVGSLRRWALLVVVIADLRATLLGRGWWRRLSAVLFGIDAERGEHDRYGCDGNFLLHDEAPFVGCAISFTRVVCRHAR